MPSPDSAQTIAFADFDRIDIRVGRIVQADLFPEARNPAFKLLIDFGSELGTRTSSAQLTHPYRREELEGRLVVAVLNFPPRQIGPFMSQVLTLGFQTKTARWSCSCPTRTCHSAGRMF